MHALFQMAGLVADALVEFARQPDLLIVTAAVLFLLYGQYARVAQVETRLFGAPRNNPMEQALCSLVAGLTGGLFATALFVFVGVPLSGAGIWRLWILAMALALAHPRFLCFSYAGGLLSIAHLIWGIPGVSVPAVIAIVAALHMVEAVLIAATGAYGATPVYVRSLSGETVGGMILQRFWPIPFAALVAGAVEPDVMALASDIAMPDWWPLIKPSAPLLPGYEMVFSVMPVVAALGYSELSLTRQPAQKARSTAGWLVVYSLALLGLAVAAQYQVFWAWIAALFAPLGHEWVIMVGRQSEYRCQPAFTAAAGAMVLDVLPGTPAEKMGLRSGDVVKMLNGEPVRDKHELAANMLPWVIGVKLEVENIFDHNRRVLSYEGKIPPLGAVFVPDRGEPYFVDPSRSHGLLQRLWRRMANKWGGVRR